MNRVLGVVAASVCGLSALLTGCAPSQAVSGRVLSGKAGLVMVVPSNDARLAEGGVGGVRVRAMAGAGATASLGEGVSHEDGSFSFRVPAAGSGKVEIVATADDVLTTRGTIYVPEGGGKVLVIVEPKRVEPAR